MIAVTEQAKAQLKTILIANVDYPEAVLRLLVREQGKIGLGIDIEMPGDNIVEHDGKKVLVVAAQVAREMADLVLDTEDTTEGTRLVICQKEAEHPV